MCQDFMSKIVFVYPGQGSQSVKMGEDIYHNIPESKYILDELSDMIHQDLKNLICHAPEDVLKQTQNAQPAIFSVSLMIQKAIETVLGKPPHELCQAMIGHSLGEYTALTCAGALQPRDGVFLVKIRGQLMQQSFGEGSGAMAAIIGLPISEIESITHHFQNIHNLCCVANDNSLEQVIVSGHIEAVEEVMHLSKTKGAKRCVILPVSSAFHSPLMQKAADSLKITLDSITFLHPKVPVIMNVTADILDSPDTISQFLYQQMTERVRFRESIARLDQMGFTHFVEIGPGKVLTQLIKKILPHAACFNIANIQDLSQLSHAFKSW
jgi:[acyl-carrier-protein] S-malonyltransferase